MMQQTTKYELSIPTNSSFFDFFGFISIIEVFNPQPKVSLAAHFLTCTLAMLSRFQRGKNKRFAKRSTNWQ